MKIYLSKYWRQNSLFNLCFMIFLIIALVCFCIWSNDREDYIVILCAGWWPLVMGGILLGSKRFLTYAIIENHQIQSYSVFSKKLCTVTTTMPTYYAIFSTPQGGVLIKLIAVSNEPFEYQETYGIAKVRFIQHYNMSKQIVLPYNGQVTKLLNLNDWHKMN